MQIFLDTASIDEIIQASQLGLIAGVTTNPTLVAKAGVDQSVVIKRITEIVDGPISAEVLSTEALDMVKEAEQFAAISSNVVIKIPMCWEGLKAVSLLSKAGIKSNVTLIFSANQALLAARAGATFVSPFVGRLDDISQDGTLLIEEIAAIFRTHDLSAQIIAASMRHPVHVTRAALAGAHIATISFKLLSQMVEHPLTTAGIEIFERDAREALELRG